MNDLLSILAIVGPSAVAITTLVVNRRDKLVAKVNELAERIARIEGKLDYIAPSIARVGAVPGTPDQQLSVVDNT